MLYNTGTPLDMCFVTESWLNGAVSDGMLDPHNKFTIYRLDRLNHRGGGVCVFANRNLNVAQIELNSASPDNVELLGLDLHCRSRIVYRFFLVYRPPETSPVYRLVDCDSYLKTVVNFITSNINCNGPTVVLGDFNCNNIDWDNNRPLGGTIANILTDFANYNSFTQYINHPTHGSSILDLLLINEPMTLSSLTVTAPFSNSDHCSVFFNLVFNLECNTISSPDILYNWYKGSYTTFCTYLYSIDWLFLLSTHLTVDTLWSAFCSILNVGIQLYVPTFTKNFSTVQKNVKKIPQKIRELQSCKLKAWRRHRADPLNSSLLETYKNFAKQCKREKKLHEIKNEKAILDSNNLGTFYNFVNKKMSHSNKMSVLKDSDGIPVTNDRDKAELLNRYFESVYTDDNGKLPNCETQNAPEITTVSFTAESIYATIKKIKSKLTIDPEGYSPYLLKQLVAALSSPLSLIFGTFMSVSKIPDSWKRAIVTPIFKKGSTSDPQNYRPISITSVFCKVMERIIVEKITTHLTEHKIITESQHGFLRKLSTCTNLVESLGDWTILLEGGSSVAVAYVDFSRAFDSVTHAKLLHKLKSYGISGELLEFIGYFLFDRSHCTKVGNSYSSSTKIRSGIVQGSCLGPLLFVLFINDIVRNLNIETTAKLFADDIKIYAKINTEQDATNFQKSLDIIYKWSKDWQLEISLHKCFIILLCRHSRGFNSFSFKLGDFIIQQKPSVRDLGVEVDEKLTFTNHVSNIVMNASQRSHLIFRSFTSKNPASLIRAFKIYVRPLLEYNSQVWSPITIKDITSIEKVQKQFTKRIPGCKNLTYYQRLKKFNLESLELRRLRADLKFTYKLIFNKTAVDYTKFFIIQTPTDRQLRSHNYQIRPVKRLKTNRSNQCLFYRIANMWNNLPPTTNFSSITSFESSIPSDFFIKFCKFNFG